MLRLKFGFLTLAILTFPFGALTIHATERSENLPGTEWPGGSVQSTVGGAIIDRVWRLYLPEGRVALLSLVGSRGSELGLYLFDESATDITTSVPLKTSAKPGGNQTITAVLKPGTYFVNVNGRNSDRAYSFGLRITLLEDLTPPFVEIEIANGATAINLPESSIFIGASDSLSGVDAVRYRIDEGNWSAWLPPNTVHAITFDAIEGNHIVYAQARNGAAIVSASAVDSIVLDLTAPYGKTLSSNESGVVFTPSPTLRYRFTERLRIDSWELNGLTLESPNAQSVSGLGTFSTAKNTGSFRFSGLEPGVEYVVTVAAATDSAGNPAIIDSQTLTYLVPTKISTPSRFLTARGGNQTTIYFRASGVPYGATLNVERLQMIAGGTSRWEKISEVVTRGDGSLESVEITPDRSAKYALRFVGSATHATSRTPTINVTLIPNIARLGGSEVRVGYIGNTAVAEFRVDPIGSFVGTLVRSSCNDSFTRCRVVSRQQASIDSFGFTSVTWTPVRGNWSWHLVIPKSLNNESATSARALFEIR